MIEITCVCGARLKTLHAYPLDEHRDRDQFLAAHAECAGNAVRRQDEAVARDLEKRTRDLEKRIEREEARVERETRLIELFERIAGTRL